MRRLYHPWQWERRAPHVLCIAAMLMMLASGFGALKAISLFRRALTETPLAYWTDLSFWGLIVPFCTFIWAPILSWILPRVMAPKAWAIASVAVSLVAYGVVAMWDTSRGWAVYPDRFMYRDTGPSGPLVSAPFSAIVEFRSSCIWGSGSRADRWEADWEVVLRDGTIIFLSLNGPGGLGATGKQNALSIMRLIDREADETGAWRQSMRHKGSGQPLRDPECEAAIAHRYETRDRPFVLSLFRRSPGAV